MPRTKAAQWCWKVDSTPRLCDLAPHPGPLCQTGQRSNKTSAFIDSVGLALSSSSDSGVGSPLCVPVQRRPEPSKGSGGRRGVLGGSLTCTQDGIYDISHHPGVWELGVRFDLTEEHNVIFTSVFE